MLAEPHRWVEAIRQRRAYIEDQLKDVSPVIGLPYADGLLLVTTTPGPRKIFEVYDQLALAGVGHPADMEKVRRAAIDIAHVEAYNLSSADVTAYRLVASGIGPLMKTAFDEVVRSPYIARLMVAELGGADDAPALYTVEADGSFAPAAKVAVVGGEAAAVNACRDYVERRVESGSWSLEEAVQAALHAWGCGWLAAQGEIDPGEQRIINCLGRSLEKARVEAVVLDRTLATTTKFRLLGGEELDRVTRRFTGGER